jgi:hypothetical protein
VCDCLEQGIIGQAIHLPAIQRVLPVTQEAELASD